MAQKFILYNIARKEFVGEDKELVGADMENAAMYSERSAKESGLRLYDNVYLQIPMTRDFLNDLPFDLHDTDPDTAPNESKKELYDWDYVTSGQFFLMCPYGFFGQRDYPGDEQSSPRIMGFDFHDASIYDRNVLETLNSEDLLGDDDVVVVPLADYNLHMMLERHDEQVEQYEAMKDEQPEDSEEDELQELDEALKGLTDWPVIMY